MDRKAVAVSPTTLSGLWTKKRPTKPGAYWVCSKKHGDQPWIVQAYREDDGPNSRRLVINGYRVTSYYAFHPNDLWWMGPLPEPKTPF